MIKALTYKLKVVSVFLLFTVVLLPSCSSSKNPEVQEPDPQTADFDSATLPGTYHIVFATEEGTHIYQFNENGTVLITYADDTVDTENWAVNNSGQLAITGTVDDLFSLTSGSQASGTMNVILIGDAVEMFTTGTIELQPQVF